MFSPPQHIWRPRGLRATHACQSDYLAPEAEFQSRRRGFNMLML